ncbi:MAG: hypothetical protein JXB13_04210 [Phycisphaerae bacterium]|nr:hypothetical protein [Phycisphaerae bacterium]
MACAFTTRLARTARWVATATAWAILGTSATHAAPPARIPPCPLLDPPTAIARSLMLFTEDPLTYAPCVGDRFQGEESRVGPPVTISGDRDSSVALPLRSRPDFTGVDAETWDETLRLAMPSQGRPDSSFCPTCPPPTGNHQGHGDRLTTDVAWLPDVPVIAFLMTGLAAACVRRRSVFAME